jgi:hypothetical protein
MVAIWAATPMLPMGWRIVLMIGVPFAFTTTMANFDRKARKKAKSLSENAHKRKGISQSLQQPLKAKGGSTVLRGSRLMSRKQALVMGAAGGVAGGVADAAMTTHRGAKSAVSGSSQRPGLVLGARTQPVRDEQGKPINDPKTGAAARQPVSTRERLQTGMAGKAVSGAFAASATAWQGAVQTQADARQSLAQRWKLREVAQEQAYEAHRPVPHATRTTSATPLEHHSDPRVKDHVAYSQPGRTPSTVTPAPRPSAPSKPAPSKPPAPVEAARRPTTKV